MDYPLLDMSKEQVEAVKRFNNNKDIRFEKTTCLINFEGIDRNNVQFNCDNKDQQVLFTNDRYGFNLNTVLCKKCGLIFSNPRMSQDATNHFYSSDSYRKIYDFAFGEKLEEYIEKKFKIEFSQQKKIINLNSYYDQLFFDIINSSNIEYRSVCEIGAGAGWNLKPFKSIGKDVLGYEPSRLLSNFSSKKGVKVINGFVEDVNGEYDLIILRHVLEHFLNPIKEIMKIREYTKKYLFVEVPGCINKIPSIQNAHNVNFSLNTLNYVLNKCGFKKIFLDYCRSNEFIFALFEKINHSELFEYDNRSEVNRILKVYKKFCIKLYVRKILQRIHPNLEKKFLNIYKSFV